LKLAALIAALTLPIAAASAQPAPPYVPYVQPGPYAPQAYPRSALPAWAPPTLPTGSPSLMIPNPPAPAYPPAPPPMPRW
jgi:hypothetical protein